MQSTFEKQIKKHLYGKLQTVLAFFPAGCGETALAEVTFLLKDLWLARETQPVCHLLKNAVRIEGIHLFTATELLMRSTTLSDLRLIIIEKKASGKAEFTKRCQEVVWPWFLSNRMTVKVHVNSIASHAFHERDLKDRLHDIISPFVQRIATLLDDDMTTTLYAELYKDKLTLSLSLAGKPLYQRGYRATLEAHAPLREDLAANCIQHAFTKERNHSVFVPFVGTGTLLLEYILYYFRIPPVLFRKTYALQTMPFYREEHATYLLKKAEEKSSETRLPALQCYSVEKDHNTQALFLANLQCFRSHLPSNLLFSVEALCEDVFQSAPSLTEKTAVLLNPPYGLRLRKEDPAFFYKRLAGYLKQLPAALTGFVLCPSELTWRAFQQEIKALTTYHVTQGGLDIRVTEF